MKNKMYQMHEQLSGEHFWFRARAEIVTEIVGQVKFDIKRRALEVGIGSGNMLNIIRRCGFASVDGIDIYRTAAKWYDNIYWTQFEKFNAKFTYGVIFMFDSLEHMKNDEKAIRKARNVLCRGGYLVITVPAYKWLWSRHDEENMHYRRYEECELAEKLNRNGFKIVRSTYFNTLLFPLVVITRFLNKGGLEKTNALLNSLFYHIFRLEKYWLRYFNLPFGSSLLVIATKS